MRSLCETALDRDTPHTSSGWCSAPGLGCIGRTRMNGLSRRPGRSRVGHNAPGAVNRLSDHCSAGMQHRRPEQTSARYRARRTRRPCCNQREREREIYQSPASKYKAKQSRQQVRLTHLMPRLTGHFSHSDLSACTTLPSPVQSAHVAPYEEYFPPGQSLHC